MGTTPNLDLQYPDERGAAVEWADLYEANLLKIDAIADFSEGGTKLKRVSDGARVAATTGVELFSPDQHGGIYGKVIRKYYSGAPDGPTTILEDDVLGVWQYFLGRGGPVKNLGDGAQVVTDSYFSAASVSRVSLVFASPKLQLALQVGDAFDDLDDTYLVYADFTLVTPPSLPVWP